MRWHTDRCTSDWNRLGLKNSHRLWYTLDMCTRLLRCWLGKIRWIGTGRDCMDQSVPLVDKPRMDRQPFGWGRNKSGYGWACGIAHRSHIVLDRGQRICCSHKPCLGSSPNWWYIRDGNLIRWVIQSIRECIHTRQGCSLSGRQYSGHMDLDSTDWCRVAQEHVQLQLCIVGKHRRWFQVDMCRLARGWWRNTGPHDRKCQDMGPCIFGEYTPGWAGSQSCPDIRDGILRTGCHGVREYIHTQRYCFRIGSERWLRMEWDCKDH